MNWFREFLRRQVWGYSIYTEFWIREYISVQKTINDEIYDNILATLENDLYFVLQC